MPYKMTPGGALRIHGLGEVGEPTLEKVAAPVAKRSEYLRLQFMEQASDDGDGNIICAVFKDPRTGEVYAQPIPDQEGL